MAITNHDRIGKTLELLRDGLKPFVERELKAKYADRAHTEVRAALSDRRLGGSKADSLNDIAVLLVVMDKTWGPVFGTILGRAERNFVNELVDARNRWAHQEAFFGDDVYRVLDSAGRLLAAVSAPQTEEIERFKQELLRLRYEEQSRTEKRKSVATAVESQVTGTLKPWREVISPHKDVASGKYQQAEFAADLWQVHLGEGSDEYRKPVEFFRRTYLTESLKQLLGGAVERLSSGGGDPVVQLQTNFGGGKTHSMLALYHLFSGGPVKDLVGIDEVLTKAGVTKVPAARRAVLVGNKISPGNPTTKPDGTVVRTLWGELAWQLGFAAGGAKEAKAAFNRIQADDENSTSPGDALRGLMNDYSPCLILIDEWVAYARQLHDQSDLPAGSFETQFSFAQVLTESAKSAKNCLLVISLPASDTAGSPHTRSDDVEVGGARGHAALNRLRNVVGRVESSWRPASAEEGFEIVRRRLFEPLIENEQFVARDTVARAFYEMYRAQHQEFPPEAKDAEYEQRIKAAYPIHPEIFDRLYTDWSTLIKFQRTRGVLRLMAAVIHSLWDNQDRNSLIMPGNIPIDDPRVQSELTRYLSDNWVPVIEKDIDGPSALSRKIDAEVTNLGKFAACRRVARTIYLGSAPTTGAAHQGLEDRQVKLGSVMPGESPQVFGDALRYLSTRATYLYHDGTRYWYATQPTVTKLAEDRAEQLRRNPDKVAEEMDRRLRAQLSDKRDFRRIHPLPHGGQDVPDDVECRLVVLRPEEPYSKEGESLAEKSARAILESRGNAPRLYRNSLVFLAADQARLQELDEALRKYLAWKSIVEEEDALDLKPQQGKQAQNQRDAADKAVVARIPETYQWLLVPTQNGPQQPVKWEAWRLSGTDSIAARAVKKLRSDELLLTGMAGTRLRMELDKVPLWRGDHVPIAQIQDDFARYTYLPRLAGPDVLNAAIQDGTGLLLWREDSFAYADSFDEGAGRYRGLRGGQPIDASGQQSAGMLVKSEVAQVQLQAESEATKAQGSVTGQVAVTLPGASLFGSGTTDAKAEKAAQKGTPPKRYHGVAELVAERAGRDAARIAEEVISHLDSLPGASVKVTLEIAAEVPGGVPENVVRIVTENGRTLKFTSQGFEAE